MKSVLSALRLALTIFEMTLDGIPIPGLKHKVGGILMLAKMEEVSKITWIVVSSTNNGPDIDPEFRGCP